MVFLVFFMSALKLQCKRLNVIFSVGEAVFYCSLDRQSLDALIFSFYECVGHVLRKVF